jgi:uncharacterized membrane protein YadS
MRQERCGVFFARNTKEDAIEEIATGKKKPLLPYFLYGFAVFVLLRTFDLLPVIVLPAVYGFASLDTQLLAVEGSRFLMIVSMAALGLDTCFRQLKETGGKPFAIAGGVSVLTVIFLSALLYGMSQLAA